MSKIDWNDPEQVRAYNREYYADNREHICEYQREWRRSHRTELLEKEKEARRNRPIGDGGKRRGRKDIGWLDAAYCTENRYAEEISWDIDKEKMRRNVEE